MPAFGSWYDDDDRPYPLVYGDSSEDDDTQIGEGCWRVFLVLALVFAFSLIAIVYFAARGVAWFARVSATAALWRQVVIGALVLAAILFTWRFIRHRARKTSSRKSSRAVDSSHVQADKSRWPPTIQWWVGLTPAAYRWLGGFMGALGAIFVATYRTAPGTPLAGWPQQLVLTLVALVLPILTAMVMHVTDRRRKHLGFTSRYSAAGAGHDILPAGVSGLFTMLSIRVALTLGILSALLTRSDNYVNVTLYDGIAVLTPLPHKPLWMLYMLLAAALGLSLLSSLAALICYEYSVRFDWSGKYGDEPESPQQKAIGADMLLALRRKSVAFSTFGFYALAWALMSVTALIDYRLAFATVLCVYLTMWTYYYFPKGANERHLVSPPTT